jgi:hypothetical protein
LEYTPGFVLAVIANDELISSFLESTTGVLTPSHYDNAPKQVVEFLQQEGHTLWNTGNRTTNVPSRGGMRENLIIWRADIAQARKTLSLEEDMALMQRASRKAGRPSSKLTEVSERALAKVCAFLNDDGSAD